MSLANTARALVRLVFFVAGRSHAIKKNKKKKNKRKREKRESVRAAGYSLLSTTVNDALLTLDILPPISLLSYSPYLT